jgi:hypothetical protein
LQATSTAVLRAPQIAGDSGANSGSSSETLAEHSSTCFAIAFAAFPQAKASIPACSPSLQALQGSASDSRILSPFSAALAMPFPIFSASCSRLLPQFTGLRSPQPNFSTVLNESTEISCPSGRSSADTLIVKRDRAMVFLFYP